MDADEVRTWFGEYLDAFAACGRGESATSSMLAFYGVPLIITVPDGVFVLMSEDEVVGAIQQQVDGMREADYHHSEILSSDTTVLNATSALYRGEFSRRRRDGHEINRLAVTYLIISGPAGRRISTMAVHDA